MGALELRDPGATTSSTSTGGRCSGPTRSRRRSATGRRSRHASVVVGNRAEVAVAVGEHEPEAAATALLALGPRLAIVKLGGEGVLVATEAGE